MVVALRGAWADSCDESCVSLKDAVLEIRASIEGRTRGYRNLVQGNGVIFWSNVQ